MIIQTVVNHYDFNLAYAHELVADITDEQFSFTPGLGLENHPAFTLGHLVSGSAMLAEDLGVKVALPNGWSEIFERTGPGDVRLPNRNRNCYPTKTELLEELNKRHEVVKQCLARVNAIQLQESVNWRFSKYFPTLLDLVVFMCISHESMHLAQLASWRRAMGLPSALAKL